jgi:chemotaxis protein methyltransferase CheR
MTAMARILASTEPAISEADYEKFCEFFYRQTGISFGEKKQYFVDKRLIERIQKTGAENFSQYFSTLRRSDSTAEFEKLVNLLTVNETYFFREDHQFDCMAQHILPEITARKRKGERLRIWSMPCSTGEEPYSIAIFLLEKFQAVDDFDIEIMGSDIDTNVLAAARRAVYEKRALHRLSHTLIQRYFNALPDDTFRLSETLRDSVRFTQVNCTEGPAMRPYTNIDLIFCRNMLIYFDDKSRLTAAQHFYDCLAPGGFICLGHAESMARISAIFAPRSFPQGMVYQKPHGGR